MLGTPGNYLEDGVMTRTKHPHGSTDDLRALLREEFAQQRAELAQQFALQRKEYLEQQRKELEEMITSLFAQAKSVTVVLEDEKPSAEDNGQ